MRKLGRSWPSRSDAALFVAAAAVALPAAPALAQSAEPAAAASSAAPVAHFMVRAIQVKGNHLLAAGEVEAAVYPFMGPDKTPDDIENARAALQAVFEKRGFATVSVFIPEQSVDSGIIQLEVQPQAIGQLTVAGGRRTSADWVKARAPSLAPGVVPNFQAVQRDVVGLNAQADRRITPDVKAGVAPGTVDVVLNVEDSLPLHGSLELNNSNSAETSDLRASASLRYDDLWGRGDSLSVSAQTAPRRSDDGTVYSANYLTHLGRAQLLGYYVRSDSDIAVVGGTSVIGKGDLAGLRVILPLSQSEAFYQSLTFGIDYKNFKEDVALGADRSSAPIQYYPVTLGWRGDWTGKRAKSNLSVSTTFGIRGLGDDRATFDFKRFQAKPDFFYVRGDGASTIEAWKGFQVYLHLSGQWSDAPLVSNEEFSVGGADTVRGYYESETLGDWGAALQSELRSPNLASAFGGGPIDEVRLHLFADTGIVGIHEPLVGQKQRQQLTSAGLGGQLKLLKHINGAVDVGAPLRHGPDSPSGDVFARFRIWGEF